MKIRNCNKPKFDKIDSEITGIILRIPGNKSIAFEYGSSEDKAETANVFVSAEGMFYGSYNEFMAEKGIKRLMPETVRRSRLAAEDGFKSFLQKVIDSATGYIIIRQDLCIETNKTNKTRPVSQRKIYGIKLCNGDWQPLSKKEVEKIHKREAEDMVKSIGNASFIYSDLSEFLGK
jgi:hypothetical protein